MSESETINLICGGRLIPSNQAMSIFKRGAADETGTCQRLDDEEGDHNHT